MTMSTSLAPADDRFAHWPRARARVLLAVVAVMMVLSAWVPINSGPHRSTTYAPVPVSTVTGKPAKPPRDEDLELYDRIIARIGHGENYYAVATDEQRRGDYPVRPGLAVRFPTLAYLLAWLGTPGQIGAAVVLLGGILFSWWRRMADEPGGPAFRNLAIALAFLGASQGLNRYYYVMHELWAGMLLALAFGLHRPTRGKWLAALLVAALAVAVREHCLPFVLLMAAYALWRRAWPEAAAWTGLALAFFAALALHIHMVGLYTLAADRFSPPWLVFRGLSGWLSMIVLPSTLHYLPHWLAGPMVIAMVLGWAGWRAPAGAFGTLLYLGYGLLFMIAGRPNNFYWGAVVAPAMFIGLAFVPRALASLVRAARLPRPPAPTQPK